MSVVTITSDWSKSDYYLSTLKGKLLSHNIDTKIVDISNDIASLDVIQAMFLLRSSYPHFPAGTIHLLCVDSEPTADEPMVILESGGHYFVGINDGRFSHLLDTLPPFAYQLPYPSIFSSFLSADLFVKAVKIIEDNSFIRDTQKCDIRSEVLLRPVCTENEIIGRVIYIDSFGNAIVNITRTLLDSYRKGRDFDIMIQGPYAKIPTISRGYSSVNDGEKVAFFNSLGYLEIALNRGNIAESEGLHTSSEIIINFYNE